MCMASTMTPSTVLKQLAGVTEKLDAPDLTRDKRLMLLRQQAQLCDLRDAHVDRLRRARILG
jgi:hypothetical protein